MQKKQAGKMEFHISRQARDLYQFDESLFSQSGNAIFANFHAARVFAQKVNQRKDLVSFPEQAVRAGQINAMGLIDEILHMVVSLYRQQAAPQVMAQALEWLAGRLGKEPLDATLLAFAAEFPPLAVYRREISPEEYLEGQSDGTPNRQILLEEMLMLWLANANPAFSPFFEFFDDSRLKKETSYARAISLLREFYETQPKFGPDNQNLVDMLRSPAIEVPYSLPGQLEYIRSRWFALLGRYLYRLFSSLDLIAEEEKAIFLGPGPARVYEFTGLEAEPERFSPDKDWMPRLVLIAKNSYVWLDQLSRKYQRPIHRLDQIPDEELDQLANWGFTGLWLIGLWERSRASRTIKQMRGNPDAVASAYSLMSYEIAEDLGGEQAYQDLSRRAWQRGIRLSSDMVPNHMGIDSHWVMDHPDWFISLDYSPFPSYTFNGPNLSWNDRVGLYLEDHYYDSTDAAVVFKRVDRSSGETRYIYHGNDGTSMPWNDTAQLNYLNPEVREAVIQTILHVARKFPVIRFDAAMTLAKKHYQRLWFPEPGTGGAIPSRAEHGMTKEQFDAAFPQEFWREVVDRVAQEVPDTLLLAEAFWLMEGYFVRSLGMHRVYNSAFMNMLRDEKNAEYRLVIKNTLEFDPEILKRYVNFMNNPDERTAVDQFGKGDKYFGICTLLATMPGLPMFGHGQIEGFTERYGMEFRRAYWDEQPDPNLIERHEREIFPLLRRRHLFAEVKDFLLYDFYAAAGGPVPEGSVNEDVFAYSNRSGGEASLVIYHNKFATARGWIRTSAAFAQKNGAGRRLVQRTLGQGLGLRNEEGYYTIFRDHASGLEYIRSNRELFDQGLYVELEAYQSQVFLDFRQVQDDEWRRYAQLAGFLNGHGVPSIDEALREIFLQPIHQPFRELVNAGFFRWVIDHRLQVGRLKVEGSVVQPANLQPVLDEAEQKTLSFLGEVKRFTNGSGDEAAVTAVVRRKLAALLRLPALDADLPAGAAKKTRQAVEYLQQGLTGTPALAQGDIQVWGTLLGWLFIHEMGKVITGIEGDEGQSAEISRSWIDEWLLGKILTAALQDLGLDEESARQSLTVVKLLTRYRGLCQDQASKDESPYPLLETWLRDGEIQTCLGVNRYQGILWFHREAFDNLLWWMFTASAVDILAGSEAGGGRKQGGSERSWERRISACYDLVVKMQQAEERSGYQVDQLLEAARM